jgi:plastocyanin
MRKLLYIAVAVALVAVLAGCAGGVTSKPDVTITDKGFQPGQITVKAGTEVKWTSTSAISQTVTIGDIDSGGLNKGDIYTYTFLSPGRYTYMSRFQPENTGVVIVR